MHRMINKIINARLFVCLAIISMTLLFLNGCAVSQPTRFYTLSAMEKPKTVRICSADTVTVTIAIAPLELPKYLDRPQIMTRVDENELELSELDQWAEPIDENISNVMAQNLRFLLCADIETFPVMVSRKIDYRLSASIIRLEGKPGGDAFLEVRWSVSGAQSEVPLFVTESSYREPVRSRDHKGLVSAYSLLFASLSREIAGSLEPFLAVRPGNKK